MTLLHVIIHICYAYIYDFVFIIISVNIIMFVISSMSYGTFQSFYIQFTIIQTMPKLSMRCLFCS